jgi:hypothetical protein
MSGDVVKALHCERVEGTDGRAVLLWRSLKVGGTVCACAPLT